MDIQLMEAERDFLLQHLSQGYLRIINNKIDYINPQLLESLGYTKVDEMPQLLPELIYDQQGFLQYSTLLIGHHPTSHITFSLKHRNGSKVVLRCETMAQVDSHSTRVFLLTDDITLQYYKQQELLKQSTVFQYCPYALAITDEMGTINRVNWQFQRQTGFQEKSICGQGFFNIKRAQGQWHGISSNGLLKQAVREKDFVIRAESRSFSGPNFLENIHIQPFYEKNLLTGYLMIARPLTPDSPWQMPLSEFSCHELNSGLISKEVFSAITDGLKHYADEQQMSLCLMRLCAANLNELTARYGKTGADQAMAAAAASLRQLFGEADVLARLQDDEIAVLSPQIGSPFELGSITEKIKSHFKHHPIEIDNHSEHLQFGIGSCLYQGQPGCEISADDILSEASRCLRDGQRSQPPCDYRLLPAQPEVGLN